MPGKAKGGHPQNRLTAATVRRIGPGRHADGNGLYLEVKDSGARRWFLRTVVNGHRRDVGLGGCSLVSLAEARDLARELRKVARAGGDPVAERDKGKRQSLTFEEAARKVHEEQIAPSSKGGKHLADWISSLERLVFPLIGKVPVHAVTQADVLRVLAPIWTETPETARRVRQRMRTVLDWARTAGLREGINPVDGIEKGLPKQRDRAQHFKALPWRDLPDLMKRIEDVEGMGALALRFAILTAARSGEVRGATWAEIDLKGQVWTIPAERMKAQREHRVPLSAAARAVLEKVLDRAAAADDLVFPSQKAGRPLSDMTLSAVLRRLEVPVTVHGMRSTFRGLD